MGGSYSGAAMGGGPAVMGTAGHAGVGGGGGRVVMHGGNGCCGTPAHLNSRSGMYSGGSFVGGGGGVGPGGGTVIEPTPGCGVGSTASDTGCCVGGPETQCGGVGNACFESSGNMVTTTDWSYVGQGRGGYSVTPSYNYVGEGAGAYSKDVIVTPYGCRIRPCCILLALLALLHPEPQVVPQDRPLGSHHRSEDVTSTVHSSNKDRDGRQGVTFLAYVRMLQQEDTDVPQNVRHLELSRPVVY